MLDERNEIWRRAKIPGDVRAEYEVSNYGNVRRTSYVNSHGTRTTTVKKMKLQDNGTGYSCIYVKGYKKKHILFVHRLVANAFLQNPNNYREVNHKDFNRKNNHVENLEWCTHSQNMQHASKKLSEPRIRKVNPSKTGYKYIYYRKSNNLYRVGIRSKSLSLHIDRSFKNLDDAIKFRNEVCSEIGYAV